MGSLLSCCKLKPVNSPTKSSNARYGATNLGSTAGDSLSTTHVYTNHQQQSHQQAPILVPPLPSAGYTAPHMNGGLESHFGHTAGPGAANYYHAYHPTSGAGVTGPGGFRGGSRAPEEAMMMMVMEGGGPPAGVHPMEMSTSQGNLQHISEREPDDIETDPSLNPTKRTLFLSRSIHEVEQNLKKRRSIYDRSISRRYFSVTRRYSSCASIILDDSTVSRPNGKSTVRALALAVYYQIRNRDRQRTEQVMADTPPIFDEKLHPFSKEAVPSNYATVDPDFRTVYRFIRTLFQMAQLSPECAVVTMVYLERLLSSAEIDLVPGNWKRILLCCILLASKVWDDQAVWNVDYCQILRDLRVDDVNELERQFLELIQFNINVPASVYAKYYFDIRALVDSSHPMPLSRDRAFKLEAILRICEDQFRDLRPSDMGGKRYGSLDTMTQLPRFQPAMLPH